MFKKNISKYYSILLNYILLTYAALVYLTTMLVYPVED